MPFPSFPRVNDFFFCRYSLCRFPMHSIIIELSTKKGYAHFMFMIGYSFSRMSFAFLLKQDKLMALSEYNHKHRGEARAISNFVNASSFRWFFSLDWDDTRIVKRKNLLLYESVLSACCIFFYEHIMRYFNLAFYFIFYMKYNSSYFYVTEW